MSAISLKQNIQNDMKEAMKAKEASRLGVIRLLLSAIKQVEVDERIEMEDPQILAVIDKMIKQRQDSINQFQQAGRQDLADQEAFEISILQAYLPPPLSDDEVQALVQAAIEKTGATSMKEMSSVMAILKPQLQGRADMGAVSKIIKAKLV